MTSAQTIIDASANARPTKRIETKRWFPLFASSLILTVLSGGGTPNSAYADIRADVMSSLGHKSEINPQRRLVEAAVLRSSPRPSGAAVATLQAWSTVELLELVGEGQWAKVRTLTKPAQVGYLRAELLNDVSSDVDLSRLNKQSNSPQEVALLHRNRVEEQRRTEELLRQQSRQDELERIRQEEAERAREEAEAKAKRDRADAELRERQDQYADQRRRQSAREWAARTAPPSGVGFPPPQQRAPTGWSKPYSPGPMANTNAGNQQQPQSRTNPSPAQTAKSSGGTTVSPGGSATRSSTPSAPRTPTRSYDVVPTATVAVNDTWFGTREKALEYAQLKGINRVVEQCYAKKARAERDDKARWTFGQPDCRQGGAGGREWKCEVKVSYPCFTSN